VNEGFAYSFPAIKGIQAAKEYYVTMCPLRLIPRLFHFDEEDLPAEFRAQRVLNRSRVPEIAQYILENPTSYVFSALTASIDGEFWFASIEGNHHLGILSVSMDARFVINDGQHRRAAIEEAIRQRSELGQETISVVFFKDVGLAHSQQVFADLNKHAVNTTKSIGILYDARDDVATLTKVIVRELPMLRDYTEMELSNLPKFSPKLFTLSNIYNTNTTLLGNKGRQLPMEHKEALRSFWRSLCQSMYEWELVQQRRLKASEMRKHYLHSFGITLEAIALICSELLLKGEPIEGTVAEIASLNWHRSNTNDWWGNIIGPSGRVSKNKASTRLTALKIVELLGLDIVL